MLSSRSTMTVAVSAGIMAAAVVLAMVAPGAAAFFSDEVPRAYGVMRTWLTPPYLYFIINAIIISIAASSRFHKPSDDPQPVVRPEIITPTDYSILKPDHQEEEVPPPPPPPPPPIFVVAEEEPEPHPVVPISPPEPAAPPAVEEEEFVISRSSWTPKRRESHQIPTESSALPHEKPLVSARFGRRGAKASPDGKAALGVSRPKKGETLESTWKAITDGRAVPLARHLKKSDTWGAAEQHGRGRPDESPAGPEPVMRKSETLKERGGGGRMPPPGSPSSSGGSGRLRREASLGQDDLNRRVEAFIKKFNEEMRLQRQESYQHYRDMIDSSGGGGR